MRDDLEALRQAARQPSIEKRSEQLLKVLAWLGKAESMQLALSYFEWYLPRFKELYPAETWVEKRFEEAKIEVFRGYLHTDFPNILPEIYNKQPDVNMRNIQHGVMHNIWCMVNSMKYNPTRCTEYARDVILSVLMTVRREYSVRVPPEFLQEGKTPDLGTFVTNLWLALADKIEARLKLKYPSAEVPGNPDDIDE